MYGIQAHPIKETYLSDIMFSDSALIKDANDLRSVDYALPNLGMKWIFLWEWLPGTITSRQDAAPTERISTPVGSLDSTTTRKLSMEGGLDDLVLSDFIVQGAAADPEPFGSEFLVPAALGQHFLQQALFILNDGLGVAHAVLSGG